MSNSTSHRASGPPLTTDAILTAWAVGGCLAAAVAFGAGVHLAALVDGSRRHYGLNPFVLALRAFRHQTRLPAGWPYASAGIALLIGGLGVLCVRAVWAAYSTEHVDRAARQMAHGPALGRLREQTARADAERLGQSQPGLRVARAVGGADWLYQGWEDVAMMLMGPRSGKTVSHAIPAIMEAPGAVLVTSNKRDIVDATRGARAVKAQTFVFDPQGLANEPAGRMWWNPLSMVTDEVKAMELADIFALASATDTDAKGDRFFDGQAQELLAWYLLAAAEDGRPLTQVRMWVSQPDNLEPARILNRHGYPMLAAATEQLIVAPGEQRLGVFATAAGYTQFMLNRQAMAWCAPPAATTVEQFDPARFVTGNATLYSLSKEGIASAAPVVTALTAAVCQAAEALASTLPYGRLAVPLVAVLDEAANVCRWRQLPDLYSHYGSRGILPLTILQSWAQGEEAWGKLGMMKLWSASTVRTIGAGLSDTDFLDSLARLIGDFDHFSWSESHGDGRRTVTRQVRRERILDVADLAAMPRGREVLIAAGQRPVLARSVMWKQREYRQQVEASLAEWEPTRAREERLREESEWLDAQAREEAAWGAQP